MQLRGAWFRSSPPQPALDAYRTRLRGTLVIEPGITEFRPRKGPPIRLDPVLSVENGSEAYRGPGAVDIPALANSWIEVGHGDASDPAYGYLMDGRLLGWSSILRGNQGIEAALREAMPSSGVPDDARPPSGFTDGSALRPATSPRRVPQRAKVLLLATALFLALAARVVIGFTNSDESPTPTHCVADARIEQQAAAAARASGAGSVWALTCDSGPPPTR